jgi:5-methylcytosine-specific restriction endonuclease McrA
MKLPNFIDSDLFNGLRRRIGAPLSFYKLKLDLPKPQYKTKVIAPISLAPLPVQGLDVAADEISVYPDGTLVYRDRRVLIHIRDVNSIGGRTHIPRFHIANCRTLIEMKSSGRFEKYVAADNEDGNFHVRYNAGPIKLTKLDVCQNCLDKLSWNGFNSGLDSATRARLVGDFSIKNFFLKYPKTLHPQIPIHTPQTAPINDYPDNWEEISNELKRQLRYRCQNKGCNIQLSYENKSYLHVHHINGLKNDCAPNNLICLCIKCHADQPNHNHIKDFPEYKKFITKFF